MFICYSRFFLLIIHQQLNINIYNFLYCSARKDSSSLHYKKVEVETCLDVLGYKYLPDLFSQWNVVVILGIKLAQLVLIFTSCSSWILFKDELVLPRSG